jgi:hypothetical protein
MVCHIIPLNEDVAKTIQNVVLKKPDWIESTMYLVAVCLRAG